MKTKYVILPTVLIGFLINSAAQAQGVPAVKSRTENEKQRLSFKERTFSGGVPVAKGSNGVPKLSAGRAAQQPLASDKPAETTVPKKIVAPKMPPMQQEKSN